MQEKIPYKLLLFISISFIAFLVVRNYEDTADQDDQSDYLSGTAPESSGGEPHRREENSVTSDESGSSPGPATNLSGAEDGVSLGVFGSPVIDPYDTYQENIDDALNGDPEAQFLVSNALFECKGLPTQTYLDALIEGGTLTQELEVETQQRVNLCRELTDQIPKEGIDSWVNWLEASADQGFPLAMAREAVFKPGKYSQEQAKEIMRVLVRESGTEKYPLIMAYYVNYKEIDKISYHAWAMLSCEQIRGCQLGKYLGGGSEQLRPNEAIQSQELADNIRSAIKHEEWDKLEF